MPLLTDGQIRKRNNFSDIKSLSCPYFVEDGHNPAHRLKVTFVEQPL